MQAVLLPAFCASGNRNPIRIKLYRKQVERVFLDGVLLLQPPGCLPAPWSFTSTDWLEHGEVGGWQVREWSSFWASVPAGCALLGLGSGGVRTLSFPAVSLTGSGDVCC